MKNLLLAVLSSIIFFTGYSNYNTLEKRHGVKGLNEAMKENGKPNLSASSKGYVVWKNGKITDMNGNDIIDFSKYNCAWLCNGSFIETGEAWTTPIPVYNLEGGKILDNPISEKALKLEGIQLYNRILVLKELLYSRDPEGKFGYGVYTVDGEEIVPLGTSWKETYSMLTKYKGSERIKRNINLMLKFGTYQKQSSEYHISTEKMGYYIIEYKNGQYNVIDIEKGGYIAKGIENNNTAESFMKKDFFINYSAGNFTKDNISIENFQELFEQLDKLDIELREKGYESGGFCFGSLCFFLRHESGQYHLVNLDGDVLLSADYIDRVIENDSYESVLFVENFGGNSFFICYDTNPMNDKDIHRFRYNEYFGQESYHFLPEIPKAVRDAIQIPTVK